MKNKSLPATFPDIPGSEELSAMELNRYKLDVMHSIIKPGMLRKVATPEGSDSIE